MSKSRGRPISRSIVGEREVGLGDADGQLTQSERLGLIELLLGRDGEVDVGGAVDRAGDLSHLLHGRVGQLVDVAGARRRGAGARENAFDDLHRALTSAPEDIGGARLDLLPAQVIDHVPDLLGWILGAHIHHHDRLDAEPTHALEVLVQVLHPALQRDRIGASGVRGQDAAVKLQRAHA